MGAGIYDYGTEVTLTATAHTGYIFEAWSDGNTDNPCTFTVIDDGTLTATFKQNAAMQFSETHAETDVEKVLRNGNTYDLTGHKLQKP